MSEELLRWLLRVLGTTALIAGLTAATTWLLGWPDPPPIWPAALVGGGCYLLGATQPRKGTRNDRP